MQRRERQPGDVTADDLYRAACACADARLRGAILALASLYEGDALHDAARLWGVDPATLRDLVDSVNEDGLRALTGFAGDAG